MPDSRPLTSRTMVGDAAGVVSTEEAIQSLSQIDILPTREKAVKLLLWTLRNGPILQV